MILPDANLLLYAHDQSSLILLPAFLFGEHMHRGNIGGEFGST